MANDIDKTSSHYKGEFSSIYEVNQKYPSGGVAGDYVEIDGWAHYWNADRGTWCVNARRDEYWDEKITTFGNTLNAELQKKFDKSNVVQTTGTSATSVMSQEAVSGELETLQSTINSKVETLNNKLATKVEQADDTSKANLNISDEDGNIIAQFKDGHFRTKEFDSRDVAEVKEEVGSIQISVTDNTSKANLNISDEDGNIIAQFKDGHFRTKEFDSRDVTEKSYDYQYNGSQVVLKRAWGYNMGRVATISIGQGGNQGFCIYENYALAFGNGGISGTSGSNMASCRIFKITDNEGIPVFTAIGSQFLLDNYTNNHTNTASLGKKFDSNDDFPLVYIPRCMIGSNQNCVVERIFLDGTSTDVQEISIGTYRDEVNSNSDIQWTTDGENLYMFGNTRSSYATTGNKFVFAKFELPDPTTGNVAIDLNEAIEFYYFEDYGFHNTNVLQGCKVINNVMILPVGFGGTAQPSHVYFWDCLNKKLIADVDMSAISSLEFEDVDIYRDTLLIYAQGGVIYQVDFQ